ncbi:MAG TPA: hypothetical protein VGU20_22265 [Stellaceae bacterium]|nr:hypothetical protein [Stellaceae bacterium]
MTGAVQRSWRRFVLSWLLWCAAWCVGLYVFVAVVDPFDTLAFSPDWKRHRVTGNERFELPGLIKRGHFDSAVLGTSTVLLLDPGALDAALGGHFVNAALSDGRAWEQAQVMRLFAQETPQPRALIIGIDIAWCAPDQPAPPLTFRPFPTWEYERDGRAGYLHLFDLRHIYAALRQALTMTGVLAPVLGDDGYWQFVPDDALYDPVRAAAKIYGAAPPKSVPAVTLPAVGARPVDWTFPDITLLAATLRRFPPQTRMILMLVPYHVVAYASEALWPRYHFCKEALVSAARTLANAVVVDFMFPNDTTRDYRQYWDGLHYRLPVVQRVVEALRRAERGEETEGFARILLDTRAQPPSTGALEPDKPALHHPIGSRG